MDTIELKNYTGTTETQFYENYSGANFATPLSAENLNALVTKINELVDWINAQPAADGGDQ